MTAIHSCEQVELLSWQSDNDISGDGGILRTVIDEGSGWETPNDIDEITGENYVARLLSINLSCVIQRM